MIFALRALEVASDRFVTTDELKMQTKSKSKDAKRFPNTVIESIPQYIETISQYVGSNGHLKCYRGQRNASWDNAPGILRPGMEKFEEHENRAIRDIVAMHPGEFANDLTMFDRLVRMQHFGLPTRLMDVSLNPLVALYFATDPGPANEPADGIVTGFAIPAGREKYYDSDSVSCLSHLANLTKNEKQEIIKIRSSRPDHSNKKDEIKRINALEVYERLHQFIKSEKPYFLPIIDPIDLFKPYYVHPKMNNRRIFAQSGGFIIFGLPLPYRIRWKYAIEATQFKIPQKQKANIRKSLEMLGVTDSVLFPEIDRTAKRIEANYAYSERA